MSDALVIGAGPNGLVAANQLIDHGWSVTVLEAESEPGGAVRSGELIEPGFTNDHCSAFYPLGAGSPVMQALELEKFGLRWRHSPLVVAHPSPDGTCPVISRDLEESVAGFDDLGQGDGEAWRKMVQLWIEEREALLGIMFKPFPPVRAGLKLARSMSAKDLMRFARFALLPVRRFGQEQFVSEANRRLLAGLSLHADLVPEATLSGFYGWLLAMLGQDVGWPVPEGGAGSLTKALTDRFLSKGGEIACNQRVTEIIVRHGRAVGAKTASGDKWSARRAVIADVDAPSLYVDLLPEKHVPASILNDIKRFEWDHGTFKVDWTLDGPIPWTAVRARQAGTVHIADSVDSLSVTSSELSRKLIPKRPFLLFGQYSMMDSTRAPEGKETAWAYTHVPIGVKGDNGGSLTGKWDASENEQFTERMEDEIEALAPGFRELVRGRHVQSPGDFQAGNRNLFGGALGGGTSQIHQQLIFRPSPGFGRAETPIQGLYLGSASAHPGGGVHGACGSNAARAALLGWRYRRPLTAVRWVGRRRREQESIVP